MVRMFVCRILFKKYAHVTEIFPPFTGREEIKNTLLLKRTHSVRVFFKMTEQKWGTAVDKNDKINNAYVVDDSEYGEGVGGREWESKRVCNVWKTRDYFIFTGMIALLRRGYVWYKYSDRVGINH